MAKSELDKLLAATHAKGGTGSARTDFTRLMAEVLRLTRSPKSAPVTDGVVRRLAPVKVVHPDSTIAGRLLKAASVIPVANGAFPQGGRDLGRLAAQVDQLRRAMTPAAAPVAVKTRSNSASTPAVPNGSNGLVKFISTFLGGSGLGSIISEIAGLFGGGKPDAPLPLYQFALPQSVSIEAGLTRNGQFVPISYSQSGQARPNSTPQPVAPTVAQPLNVDGRWFMDHSEEIASAVKEAMLHSHSINDVVADL
jgi:hypothetical protein